jgi:hypothetical protein
LDNCWPGLAAPQLVLDAILIDAGFASSAVEWETAASVVKTDLNGAFRHQKT